MKVNICNVLTTINNLPKMNAPIKALMIAIMRWESEKC